MVSGALLQFPVTQTACADYSVIDMPPGAATSSRPWRRVPVAGVVIVKYVPSRPGVTDARKGVEMCPQSQHPGVVENMAAYLVPTAGVPSICSVRAGARSSLLSMALNCRVPRLRRWRSSRLMVANLPSRRG